MSTLLECLKSLPPNLIMRDLAAVRNEVAPVSDHIGRLHRDEDGYEVREELRNYGRVKIKAVGVIGGPTIFRQEYGTRHILERGDMAQATTLQAAIKFVAVFAGVAVREVDIDRDFEFGNQQILSFKLPPDHDIEGTKQILSARLGVPIETFHDHHGEQNAWDIERDKKRVTLCQKFGEAPVIGFVHWN